MTPTTFRWVRFRLKRVAKVVSLGFLIGALLLVASYRNTDTYLEPLDKREVREAPEDRQPLPQPENSALKFATGDAEAAGAPKSARDDPEVVSAPNHHTSDPDVATRHLTLKERCTRLGMGTVGKGRRVGLKFPMSPVISTKHDPKLFYCPLAKAGSTYFTRYMIALGRPGPMTSPFDINIKDAGRLTTESFNSLKPTPEKLHFLSHSYRFLFVRNPWNRIFSAYIDKSYSPNPYYWNTWGGLAVRLLGLKAELYPCGAKVPFRHFIKGLISTLVRSDLHFVPMSTMCRVCDLEWNMVGLVEKSTADVDYLSKQINVSSEFQHWSNYSAGSLNDIIVDSTTDAFGEWRKEISECIPFYDAGRMVWRKLQIRGIIYSDAAFPFSRQQMETVTAQEFQDACRQAAERSTDKARLKQQKADAFQEAWSTVDKADLEKLKRIYDRDFYLFDYDRSPPSIFEVPSYKRRKEEKILDWSMSWT